MSLLEAIVDFVFFSDFFCARKKKKKKLQVFQKLRGGGESHNISKLLPKTLNDAFGDWKRQKEKQT